MIFHIVTGDMAAQPLKDAVVTEPSMTGEVIVIKDVLSVGPLQKQEGQKFSELRSGFWQEVAPNDRNPAQVDDLERLLMTGNELSKNEKAVIWLWVGALPADVCTYYWVLHYLGKYTGRLYIINIAGLPFIDEDGKLFFPKSISEVLPREVVKARRLARLITQPEQQLDADEWPRLIQENGGIRTLEGSKKITSRNAGYYDSQLIAVCSPAFQKAARVVGQAMAKSFLPAGDLFLGWRLRQLAAAGILEIQGDTAKTLRDFEVRLPA